MGATKVGGATLSVDFPKGEYLPPSSAPEAPPPAARAAPSPEPNVTPS
jgi:hypothetical protein